MRYFVLMFSFVFLSAKNITIPTTPKVFKFSNDTVIVSKLSEINVDSKFAKEYNASIQSLKTIIGNLSNLESKKIKINFVKLKTLQNINEIYKPYLKKNESYLLIIGKDNINVFSLSNEGLLNGLSTLEYLIEQNKGVLRIGYIIDYPSIRMRVLHISLWPCKINDFKKIIRLGRLNHFNKLILLFNSGLNFNIFKFLPSRQSYLKWNKEQFKSVIKYIKENGFEIIPEIKLLSHQEKFLNKKYMKHMFNRSTYNPDKKGLYSKIIFPIIDEVLKITGAKKIHIGHDEVVGWTKNHYRKKLLLNNEKQLPFYLYYKDILILYKYLKKKNIQIWMWSDMLYTKKEFASMKSEGAI